MVVRSNFDTFSNSVERGWGCARLHCRETFSSWSDGEKQREREISGDTVIKNNPISVVATYTFAVG